MSIPTELFVGSIPNDFDAERITNILGEIIKPDKLFVDSNLKNKPCKWAIAEYSKREHGSKIIAALNEAPPYFFKVNFKHSKKTVHSQKSSLNSSQNSINMTRNIDQCSLGEPMKINKIALEDYVKSRLLEKRNYEGLKSKVGKCSNCRAPAALQCLYCLTPSCKDCIIHREIELGCSENDQLECSSKKKEAKVFCPLPKDEYTEVIITHPLGGLQYFVVTKASLETIVKIQNVLRSTKAEPPNPSNIKCAGYFDGDWYRAEILSVSGVNATVKFIDFGNEEAYCLNELKQLPQELMDVPSLAFKIELNETPLQEKTLECYSSLLVMPLKEKDGVWKVNVKPEKVLSNTSKHVSNVESNISRELKEVTSQNSVFQNHSPAQEPDLKGNLNSEIVGKDNDGFSSRNECGAMNGLDSKSVEAIRYSENNDNAVPQKSFLSEKEFTEVLITYPLGGSQYWVITKESLDTVFHVQTVLKSSEGKPPIPVLKAKCAGLFEGDWYRAEIVSVNGSDVTVHFIDFGNDEKYPLNELKQLPEDLLNIPPLAFKIELGGKFSQDEMECYTSLLVKPLKKKDSVWLVSLKSEDTPASIDSNRADMNDSSQSASYDGTSKIDCVDTVGKEISNVSPKYVCPISSDDFTEVIITSHLEGRVYWVITKTSLDSVLSFQDVLKSCKSEIPNSSRNTKCCAKFDGDWYRAKITGVYGSNVTVHFIDFGNEEIYPLNELKQLPEELVDMPPLAFKIELEGISDQHENPIECYTSLEVKLLNLNDDILLVSTKPHEVIKNSSISDLGDLTKQGTLELQGKVGKHNDGVSSQDTLGADLNGLDSKSENCAAIGCSETDDNAVLQKSFLSEKEFTEVLITYPLGKCEYWVITKASLDTVFHVQTVLKSSEGKPPIPVLKAKCAGLFEGDWYRAEIVSVDGSDVTVHFIDFGNDEKYPLNELKQLPEDLLNIPPLAFKIELDGTPDQGTMECFSSLLVKPLKKKDSAWLVSLKSEETPASTDSNRAVMNDSPSKDTSSSNDVIRGGDAVLMSEKTVLKECDKAYPISPNEFTEVLITQPLGGRLFWAMKRSSLDNIFHIQEVLKSVVNGIPPRPVVSVLCAGLFEGDWYRAKIVSMNGTSITVEFIDFGNQCTYLLEDLIQLPDELKEIEPFAFKIELEETIPQKSVDCMESYTPLTVKPIGFKDGRCLVSIKDNLSNATEANHATSSVLSDLNTDISEPLKIESGVEVIISSFVSPGEIYVQPQTSANVALLKRIQQELGSCSNSSPLSVAPKPGEMLACMFPMDGAFYRGRVEETTDRIFSVFYIDYGNRSDLTLDCLRSLPSTTKDLPPCALRIGLHKIVGAFTPEALEFISKASLSGKKYRLKFRKDDFTAVIIRSDDDDASLNRQLQDMGMVTRD